LHSAAQARQPSDLAMPATGIMRPIASAATTLEDGRLSGVSARPDRPITFPAHRSVAIHRGVRHGAAAFCYGRQPSFPAGIYSALSGFIEPGETIEECGACREVSRRRLSGSATLRYISKPALARSRRAGLIGLRRAKADHRRSHDSTRPPSWSDRARVQMPAEVVATAGNAAHPRRAQRAPSPAPSRTLHLHPGAGTDPGFRDPSPRCRGVRGEKSEPSEPNWIRPLSHHSVSNEAAILRRETGSRGYDPGGMAAR
jgi:hypothetical protein